MSYGWEEEFDIFHDFLTLWAVQQRAKVSFLLFFFCFFFIEFVKTGKLSFSKVTE